MSTSHNIRVIYGFQADSPVRRDRKSGIPTYLSEWLSDHYPRLEQHNAGLSNGGSPKFFVGVIVAEVRDYTRNTQPFTALPGMLPFPESDVQASIWTAYEALKALDPDLVGDDMNADVGFWLMADAA